MAEIKNKFRFFIIAGVVLFAVLIFYSLNLRNKEHANAFERGVLYVASPIHRFSSGINHFLSSTWNDYINLVEVRKDNKKLLETTKVLNARLAANQEALLSNERLKKILELKEEMQVPSVVATVIGEDSAPWFKSILIDRGESDGLKEGMPVVAPAGVVGQVIKVASNSSRVLLLTDNASAIAATVQRSRARGIIKGKGGGLCTLEFALRDEDVQVGDMIIASGMGGIFPKGLPLGEVTMVNKGEYRIFQTVDVRPAVNLSRLEEVLVLLKQQNGTVQ